MLLKGTLLLLLLYHLFLFIARHGVYVVTHMVFDLRISYYFNK